MPHDFATSSAVVAHRLVAVVIQILDQIQVLRCLLNGIGKRKRLRPVNDVDLILGISQVAAAFHVNLIADNLHGAIVVQCAGVNELLLGNAGLNIVAPDLLSHAGMIQLGIVRKMMDHLGRPQIIRLGIALYTKHNRV